SYVVRSAVPALRCGIVANNYRALCDRRARSDAVPGAYVGAYHYRKSTEDYLDQVESLAPELEQLFQGVQDPIAKIHRVIVDRRLVHGLVYRVAQHGGRCASACVARSWTDVGNYALLPHDDQAQLTAAAQRGFEIQAVIAHTIVGANLCIAKEGRGG